MLSPVAVYFLNHSFILNKLLVRQHFLIYFDSSNFIRLSIFSLVILEQIKSIELSFNIVFSLKYKREEHEFEMFFSHICVHFVHGCLLVLLSIPWTAGISLYCSLGSLLLILYSIYFSHFMRNVEYIDRRCTHVRNYVVCV